MLNLRLSRLLVPLLVCTSPSINAEEIREIDGNFTLTRIAENEWRGKWCTDEAVDQLVFGPAIGDYRQAYWKFSDKAYSMGDYEGEDAISQQGGNKFQCVEATITPYEVVSEKEYVSFSRFSNGGMTVFTGHMQPWALINGKGVRVNFEEKFVALKNETTVIPSSEINKRRFVYFGPDIKKGTSMGISLIDPNVPKWLSGLLNKTISTASDVLSTSLNYSLNDPYVVLIPAAKLYAFNGYSIKGGALDNQIQFTLRGKDIVNNKDWISKDFPRLVAHEIAHVFQTNVWKINGGHLPWLTEGGADALAFDIMLQSGIWDKEFYKKYKKAIFDRCVKSGSNLQLTTVHEQGRYDIAYSCGAVVNWLAADLVNKKNSKSSTLDIWAAMDKTDIGPTSDYQNKFFKALKSLRVDKKSRDNLLAFIETKHQNMATAIKMFKETNGI